MAQSISGEKAERALKHAGAWIAKHKSGLNEVVKAGEAAGLPFLIAAAEGARTPAALTAALSTLRYPGLAMTYYSDGTGNMAHSSVIVCYDGKSRVPNVAWHFDQAD